ncbi:hypothetical protein AV274_4122 [Blastocystis sp. ATCC 50177/Nand II]|uniref:Uncharacterized protein n=1 Tax=Blastocystis sp. subtype 1 (strain ATCC 50177 / NandII) TaxID=478820 RepID=A0A196SDX5_BLAHN|nr:hypothetical protein AV274_4122 [Blastocystis sp. ATCC 50177/Nand II]
METVETILLDSTEKDSSHFLEALRSFLSSPSIVDAPVEEVKEKSEEEKRADAIRERINRERLEAQKETQKRKTINVKEMQQREKLLNTYGFDIVEADEDGNLIYREKKEEKDPMDGVNENALRVKLIEKKKREDMKAQHDMEVRRNKELEAKRKADQEKKKTVRKERRGRGDRGM